MFFAFSQLSGQRRCPWGLATLPRQEAVTTMQKELWPQARAGLTQALPEIKWRHDFSAGTCHA